MSATCNLCGESCVIFDDGQMSILGGLFYADAIGGYSSTPGNGYGALDDGCTYKFSLCEFCLDWLFGRFRVPVTVTGRTGDEAEPWRPARVRVAEDGWRGKELSAEFERRAWLREKRS